MSPWVTIVVAVIGFLGGSGVSGIITLILQRRWKKKDEAEAKDTVSREEFEELKTDICNVKKAICASLEQNLRYLAMCYIAAKEISADDKEAYHNMHTAFKLLGGEDCDVLLEEVDKLPVKEPRFKKGEDK